MGREGVSEGSSISWWAVISFKEERKGEGEGGTRTYEGDSEKGTALRFDGVVEYFVSDGCSPK